MAPGGEIVGMSVATVDELLVVPRMPESDGTLRIERFDRQGGGIAATALVAASRLGCATALISVVGADPIGDEVIAGLRAEGVGVARVRRDPAGRTNFSIVLVESGSGKRSIIYWPGEVAPLALEAGDLALVRGAAALLVDGHALEANIEAARAAREAGVPVMLDGTRAYPGLEALIPWIDILVATRAFVADHAPGLALREGLETLRAMGPREVAATGGEEGCWLLEEDGLWHLPAFPVRAVDTTGAGDVFHGAYLAARVLGMGPREVCRWAAAAAALKCRDLGGRRAIPTRPELEAFLARAGAPGSTDR